MKNFGFPRIFRLILFLSLILSPGIPGRTKAQKAKQAGSRRIAYAEARRLLGSEAEGNLSHQPGRFSRTRLAGGQVLEIYYPIISPGRSKRSGATTVTGYGVLYESEEAFKDATRPRHMLEDLLPDGRALVPTIPELVARLEKRLRLGPGKLDYSRASLRRIDSFISGYQSSRTTAQTDPKLFQELTAYYGETLRRAVNGQWSIREEKVSSTHIQAEPNIIAVIAGRNLEIKPWSSVISALYDEDKRGIGLTRVFDSDQMGMR